MAIKDLIARGVGFSPESVKYIVGNGLAVSESTQNVPIQSRYADGLHAVAMCDRCGVKKPYLELRLEPWTKWRVCKRCIDPYPPQIKPKLLKDTYRVPNPRPDKDVD